MDGFLLVDKAAGMTSHDVVARTRRRFATKRVGHAGTLDPMATGVLVLGVGNATRLLQYITDGLKRYDATIALGAATTTDDREGEVISTAPAAQLAVIGDDQIRTELARFVGRIMQRPSSVSAIKIAGKPAHQRIREGETVDIPAREVTISEIAVKGISRTEEAVSVEISVECSAGTYIRAIARDLGDALGVGGHLTSLRRTSVSPFSIEECGAMEDQELISVAKGVEKLMPVRIVDDQEKIELSFGRAIEPNDGEGVVAALSSDGQFLALLSNKVFGGRYMATPILVSSDISSS